MTSRLILPEHYVKGDTQLIGGNLSLLTNVITIMINNKKIKQSTEIRPPSAKGAPVVVNFNILVVDINSINVEDMDFR